MLQRLFPISFRSSDLVGLIISIVIYVVLPSILGFLYSLISGIPIIGWLLGIVMGFIGLYCFIGVIISFLVFFKIVK